jgi:hypothetical protein
LGREAPDQLAVVVGLLDRAEIPYMLAGSFASTYRLAPDDP